ncbi:hypothetical protein F4553_006949 [Allocatelliglobosispora scoriae]|uniref:Uncharacterized protein n=1 Tax=Allocatelliglobosispora scoriae TaxID=643052 RepID=A0A841C0Q7_9ACTN|nr:hypothetical protein [Allocatelliglobosispora scoriae]MBB5873515.1 hypothetical protein [Allocatelliglobosispora scoriae]
MPAHPDEARHADPSLTREWVRQATQENDAEAAFKLGCYHLLHEKFAYHVHADPWFEFAAQHSGAEMVWRVANAYADVSNPLARAWMRRAVVSESDPEGIVVGPSTVQIVLDESGDYVQTQDWRVFVRSDDRERALAALRATWRRMVWTTEDGHEFASEDDYEAALVAAGVETGDEPYTPNYISVDGDAADPVIWMDCKGGVMPLMARTMIRILGTELRAAGLRRAVLYTEDPPPQ